jgi:class 3 adenylate cyclase
MRAEVCQSHANGADFGAVVKVPVRMRRKRAMFQADCRACSWFWVARTPVTHIVRNLNGRCRVVEELQA